MYYKNSLSDHLVAFLFSARSIRAYNEILYERAFARRKKEVVRVTLARLKKKGIVVSTAGGWHLTKAGIAYAEKQELFSLIDSPFSRHALNTHIVSFDIPEHLRRERNWLRDQLKVFGYTMIQQSLWQGPGPLPSVFNEKIKELGIKKNLKTFRLA